MADRPLFPPDRDDRGPRLLHDRVPAARATTPRIRFASQKKIGVQYSSINGNGFGGYGEIVFGTKGTLVLEREQEMTIIKGNDVAEPRQGGCRRQRRADARHPSQRCQPWPRRPPAESQPRLHRRNRALGVVHPHPDPANQPRCGPKEAAADAMIALTANMAARERQADRVQEGVVRHSTATRRRRAFRPAAAEKRNGTPL